MSIPSGRIDLIPEDFEIVNRRVFSWVDYPPFRFPLRDSQSAIHDHVDSDCFINANPSWGKTFMGLAIVGNLGQKALVIVHTLALLSQWVKECEKVYGFTPSLMTGGKIKYDMPVTIANVQTLQRVPRPIIAKEFGAVIVDECHHTPARTFSTILDASHAAYKIGLSASDRRKDGTHIMFPDYFSKKVFKPEKENRMEPVIHRIKYPIRVADGEQSWAAKINDLAANEDYQRMIALTAASYANKGHKVLVLANRTKLLERAHTLTPNSTVVVGTTKDREARLDLMRSGQCKVLYGSTNIFSEGISENYLSCLILATPINNEPLMDQLIGRVVRVVPGKLQPVIVMPLLTGKTVEKQAQLMRGFFMRSGYEIKDL